MYTITMHLGPGMSETDATILVARLRHVSGVTSVRAQARNGTLYIEIQPVYAAILEVKRLTSEALYPGMTRNHWLVLREANRQAGTASEASIG